MNNIKIMKKIFSTLVVLGLVSFGFKVEAAEGACKADIHKYCSEVKPGEGHMQKCLNAHKSALSSPCKQTLKTAKKRRAKFLKACREDKIKFCANAPRENHGVVKCLQSHKPALSSSCKDSLAHPPPR